jgi:hypothetical protein
MPTNKSPMDSRKIKVPTSNSGKARKIIARMMLNNALNFETGENCSNCGAHL